MSNVEGLHAFAQSHLSVGLEADVSTTECLTSMERWIFIAQINFRTENTKASGLMFVM